MANDDRRSLAWVMAAGVVTWLAGAPALLAQDTAPSPPPQHAGLDTETLKRANDPLAAVKALNLHNYVIPDLYGTDAKANQLFVRYAQPVGHFLVRATMPFVMSSPADVGPVTGLGDFSAFAIYNIDASGNKFGI